MRISIDVDKCTACRSCELACSYHFARSFNPEISKIKITKDNRDGSMSFWISSACDSCRGEEEPLCVKYCKIKVLEVDRY